MNIRRPAACLCAAACLIPCLTACEGSKPDDGTITESQMPYGATLTVSKSHGVPIQYDKRFFDSDFLDAVANYYLGIQNKDVARYTAAQLPLYHDFELNTLYNGEYSEQDLINLYYDGIAEVMNGAFEFAFIDLADASKGTVYSDSNTLLSQLDQISNEKDGTQMSKNVDAIYELTVVRFLTEAGSNVRTETDDMLEDEELFAMHYLGKWYIIPA